MHVDLQALDDAAAAYTRAAGFAETVLRGVDIASMRAEVGLDGDSGRRVDEKVAQTQSGLIEAPQAFREAAGIIRDLRAHLAAIESDLKHKISVLSTSHDLETSLKNKIAVAGSKEETDRLKKNYETQKSTSRELKSEIAKLEQDANTYSQAAANKLEDLSGWAKAAQDRAFKHSAVGIVVNVPLGVLKSTFGLLDLIQGLTIEFFYDSRGAVNNWKSFYKGISALAESAAFLVSFTNGTYLLQYWTQHEDGQSFGDYSSKQLHVAGGFVGGLLHWSEWKENPGEAAGGVIFDVGTLVISDGAAAAKLEEFGDAAKTGRLADGAKQFAAILNFTKDLGELKPLQGMVIKFSGSAVRLIPEGVWSLTPFDRGYKVENGMLEAVRKSGNPGMQKLFRTQQTIDGYEAATETVTSFKSMDVNAITYQTPSAMRSTLRGYVEDLSHYERGSLKLESGDALRYIGPDDIANRQLLIGIPPGASASQAEVFRHLAEDARALENPVEVRIVVIDK